MKRKKRPTTLIFAVVVVVLAGLTFYDFKQAKKTEGLGEGEHKILDFPSSDISHFLLKSKTQTIELARTKGVWKMLQPKQDDADDGGVAVLMNQLESAKTQDLGDSVNQGTIDWKKYGFDPGVDIELETDNGRKESFAVSDTSAFDGSFYIRKNNRLYLGDRSWAHISIEQANQLRSHMIWRTKGEVVQIAAQNDANGEKQSEVFTKSDGKWKAEPAFDLPVSDEKMQNWVEAARDLRATDFAAENPTPKDEEQYLLKKPSLKAEYTVKKDGKEEKVTWKVGQDRDQEVFVQSSAKNEIYRISKFSLRDLRIPFEQLLDTSKVLQVPVEQAHEMDLTIDGHSLKIIKGEKDWQTEPADPSFNPRAVADFLQKLKALDPVPGAVPAKIQFQPSKNHFEVKSKEKTLFAMDWTDENDRIRWLKIPPFKEKFKVSAEPFNTLIKTEFVSKSKAGPKSQKN